MAEYGHAVRITTRTEGGRAAIEQTGAECWIGTPDRLATLRGALENVTIACWMLAEAHGDPEDVAALHGSRLEFFLSQAIDTTVRGLIYDATPGAVAPDALAEGARLVGSLTKLNAIPMAMLGAGAGGAAAGTGDDEAWIGESAAAVAGLLAPA
jgi:hypothetical protein